MIKVIKKAIIIIIVIYFYNYLAYHSIITLLYEISVFGLSLWVARSHKEKKTCYDLIKAFFPLGKHHDQQQPEEERIIWIKYSES